MDRSMAVDPSNNRNEGIFAILCTFLELNRKPSAGFHLLKEQPAGNLSEDEPVSE